MYESVMVRRWKVLLVLMSDTELKYIANETQNENSVSKVHHLCTNPTVKLADRSTQYKV